jgi:hypothetical protein
MKMVRVTMDYFIETKPSLQLTTNTLVKLYNLINRFVLTVAKHTQKRNNNSNWSDF